MVKKENVKRNTFEVNTEPEYVWKSGQILKYSDASFPLSMLGWSSINMVFEGIRGYYNKSDDQIPC